MHLQVVNVKLSKKSSTMIAMGAVASLERKYLTEVPMWITSKTSETEITKLCAKKLSKNEDLWEAMAVAAAEVAPLKKALSNEVVVAAAAVVVVAEVKVTLPTVPQ